MKNLPRLKALIRLLTQVRNLLLENVTFSQNPYGSVFLNKNHKKQVQILNIEFMDIGGNESDTIRWTYEYVFSVIQSDESLYAVEDLKEQLLNKFDKTTNLKIVDLENLLNKLEETATKFTNYCTLHRSYYNKELLFCPKCLGMGATKKIAIEYVSKESITSHKKINDGGEAIIYQYGNDNVAKVFRENKNINYALKSLTIARVMQKVETLKKVTSTTKYKYIVPEKILVDNYQIYGYVMKKVNGLPLYALKEKQFVINELGFTKKDVFEILIEVGKGIERLHNENIFIGDLNGGNILFDKSKRVFFLDFDGMGVDELSPEFYTDWYIDPVSMKKHMVTQKDDW